MENPLSEFSPEERSLNPYHHIDPGFINPRKCFSAFGRQFVETFQQKVQKDTDHWAKLANDHLLVFLALLHCKNAGVKTLGEVLQNPKIGQLFCSTEMLEGNKEVYTKERIKNRVVLPWEYDKNVFSEFGTKHFVADTGKTEQSRESRVAIIGQIRDVTADTISINPLIMGAPSFDHPLNSKVGIDSTQLLWLGYDWFETFPEDIAEFSQCKDSSEPAPEEWTTYMKQTPEAAIKEKICELLKDLPKKDWPGEQDDHFTASMHLGGKRIVSAFLFKGPAQFREMTPDMLGHRGDQIYRLAATPANLLIVQHCHNIGEAVRATLRAFAVAPHDPRRYCLIDGKDTYKILKAYGKL